MKRIFYSTWVKPVCCVSKISSDCGCQSKEIGVGMEVRLLSVGTRGFFLAASRLAFAASPNEEKTSGTQGKLNEDLNKPHALKSMYYLSSEITSSSRSITSISRILASSASTKYS